MPKFFGNIDLNKNEIQNATIQPLAVAPSNPKEGQIYYNTNDKNYYRYDGISWITYQNKILINGLLKGDGSGNISAADIEEVTTLNIDSTPTSGSNNLVTSGGVYSAIQNSSGGIATETDPVFGASPAAGITQNDIDSWDAKVSDDHKWNDVSLSHSTTSSSGTYYVPAVSSTSGTSAYLYQITATPTNNAIVKYDGSAYLKSTTPSANDNSTKVATTAYVDAAIPDTSGFITTETDPTVPSWAKASTKPSYNASEVGAVATSAVGAANGVVPLNASNKIDSTYLPSYIDDVIEGYYYNSKFYTTSAHTTEITGETGKIFVDLSTNKTYRYGGSSFTEISQGSVVSVSRDLTSGTKIGTLTINGTNTDLYAPTPISITGGASTIVSNNLTASRALISNSSGKVAVSDVTSTELGYLDGVTSAVQTQLDNKQAKITASGLLKGNGSGTISAATAGTDYQAPLPSQTNNSGKYLTTNGSSMSWGTPIDNDTKNTAGSTNIVSKIYLIGATSQADNPQTYSNSNLYYNTGLKSIASSQDDESKISQGANSILLQVSDDNSEGVQLLSMTGEGITLKSTGVGLSISEYGETSLTGLVTPTNSTDAVPKSYVDNAISQINIGQLYDWTI